LLEPKIQHLVTGTVNELIRTSETRSRSYMDSISTVLNSTIQSLSTNVNASVQQEIEHMNEQIQ
ncbi:hypothetical protein MKX03_017972, partial [Papaver bracteatum]